LRLLEKLVEEGFELSKRIANPDQLKDYIRKRRIRGEEVRIVKTPHGYRVASKRKNLLY